MTRSNSSKQSVRLHVTSPVAMTAAAVMRKIGPRPRTFRNTGLLTLELLNHDECKWPVGYDATALGNYLFCGGQTGGQSYCAKHQRLSHPSRKN